MRVLKSTEGMVTRVRVLVGSDADPVRLAGKVLMAKSDCTRLGLTDHEPTVLHDRRGTTVYKIDNIALKITSGLMAAREGEILHLLGTEFYRDHGWDDDRSWLTLRWIEGYWPVDRVRKGSPRRPQI